MFRVQIEDDTRFWQFYHTLNLTLAFPSTLLPIPYLSEVTPKYSQGVLKITPSPNTFLNGVYTHVLFNRCTTEHSSLRQSFSRSLPGLLPTSMKFWPKGHQVRDTCLGHSISDSLLHQVPLASCLLILLHCTYHHLTFYCLNLISISPIKIQASWDQGVGFARWLPPVPRRAPGTKRVLKSSRAERSM